VAARNRWKQPLHIMHGTLCRSAPPAVRSSGRHAEELEDGPSECSAGSCLGACAPLASTRLRPPFPDGPRSRLLASLSRMQPLPFQTACTPPPTLAVPATWCYGPAAEKELAGATRVKGSDDGPHPSTYDSVASPPEVHEYDYGERAQATEAAHDAAVVLPPACRPCLPMSPTTPSLTPCLPAEWGCGPASYNNRYRHAWPAAAASIAAAIEDAKRRRHRGGIWVPTGTCGRLIVPELPAPLVMPRFSWGQATGKLPARKASRCGGCKACLRPTLRKPCEAPAPRSDDAAPAGSAK
jgi:hypothetical protein